MVQNIHKRRDISYLTLALGDAVGYVGRVQREGIRLIKRKTILKFYIKKSLDQSYLIMWKVTFSRNTTFSIIPEGVTRFNKKSYMLPSIFFYYSTTRMD